MKPSLRAAFGHWLLWTLGGSLCTAQAQETSWSAVVIPKVKAKVQPPGKPTQVSAEKDVLFLTSGETLAGDCQGVADDGALKWLVTGGSEEKSFPLQTVQGVVFRPSAAAPMVLPLDVISLRNGDWLPVVINSLADSHWDVEPAIGTTWKFRREDVAAVFLGQNTNPVVTDGAAQWQRWIKNWRFDPRQCLWRYANNSLDIYFPKGSGVRNVPLDRDFGFLPQRVEVSFSISNSRWAPAYRLYVCTAELPGFQIMPVPAGLLVQTYPPELGRRRFNPRRAFIMPYPKGHDPQSRKHVIRLVVDRVQRRMVFYFNGQWLADIDGAEGNVDERNPLGTRIGFHLEGLPETHTVLQDFFIRPWSGPLPKATDPPTPPCAVYLANGDDSPAEVLQLKDDLVQLKVEGAPLDLPRDRVRQIRFDIPAMKPLGTRFFFRRGGCLTVTEFRIEKGVVHAKTELSPMEVSYSLESVSEFHRPLNLAAGLVGPGRP